MITIRIRNIIKSTTLIFENQHKFFVPNMLLPMGEQQFKDINHFIIKVNLPNDPYYWVGNVESFPKSDFRSSYGRGQTLEWWYDGNVNKTEPIFIDYSIHPDSLKQTIDEATEESRDIAWIALLLGFISLKKEIYSLLQFSHKHIKIIIYRVRNQINRF